jgi:outer membrane protein assembly factor BamD (BamD/ComL family)
MFAPCAGRLTRTTRDWFGGSCVRDGPVPSIDLLVSRLPRHEFAIRRLYVRDPEFRAVCDDYGEVHRALKHWQAADQAVPGRVAEYRRMLKELEAEALTFLNASEGR